MRSSGRPTLSVGRLSAADVSARQRLARLKHGLGDAIAGMDGASRDGTLGRSEMRVMRDQLHDLDAELRELQEQLSTEVTEASRQWHDADREGGKTSRDGRQYEEERHDHGDDASIGRLEPVNPTEEELITALEALQVANEDLERTIQQLSESEQNLESVNHNLEQRVEERTAALRDEVAQRRRSEDAARQSEERLRQVVENMPVMMYALDAEGRFIVWNGECERITGYPAEDIVEKPDAWSMLCPDEEQHKRLVARLWKSRHQPYFSREADITGKTGTTHTVAWSNVSPSFSIEGWETWGIGMDITARRHAQEALKESRNVLQNLIDSTDDQLILTDEHGVIQHVNAACAHFQGATPARLVGRSICNVPAPEGDSTWRHEVAAVIARQQPRRGELTHRGRHYRYTINPVLKHEDGPAEAAISIRDDTDQWQFEQRLRAARDEARQANESKSRFLAAASHDLRQPLQALSFFLNALEKRWPNDADAGEKPPGADAAPDKQGEVPQLLGYMRASLDSVDAHLRSLLDISKLEAGVVEVHLQAVRPGDVTRRLATEYQQAAQEKGIDFRFVHCDAVVRSDPFLLERIFRNLISNAIHYTPAGKVLVGVRRSNGNLRFEVHDTGPGITESEKERIFEEFYRQEQPGSRDHAAGLGLGLSIVKRISELLGHQVRLRSRPGQGSVFSVEVPREVAASGRPDDPEEPPAPEPKTEKQKAKEGRTPWAQEGDASPVRRSILVLENDEGVLDSIGCMLRAAGYDVLLATTRLQAIDLAVGAAEGPDFAIIDYRLSGQENGLTALREIRTALGRDLPCAVITGETEPEQLRAFKLLNVPLLHKPVRPDDLLALLGD